MADEKKTIAVEIKAIVDNALKGFKQTQKQLEDMKKKLEEVKKKFDETIKSIEEANKANLDKLNKQLEESKKRVKELEEEVKKLKNAKLSDGLGKAISGLKEKLSSLKSKFGKVFSFIAKTFSVVAKAVVAAIGSIVTAVGAFIGAAISASKETEAMRDSFKAFLGDAGSNKLVNEIQSIGSASKYGSEQLLGMSKEWVKLNETAEQATERVKAVNDMGYAFYLTAGQVEGVNSALAGMTEKGAITVQGMNQLVNSGIPAWRLLSEAVGMSETELKKLAEEGRLTGDAVNVLWNVLKDNSQDAATSMQTSTETAMGRIRGTISESLSLAGDIIRDAFGDSFSDALSSVLNFAEGFKVHIQNISEAAKEVGIKQAIVDELEQINPVLAAAVNTFLTAFSVIKDAVSDVSGVIADFFQLVFQSFSKLNDVIGEVCGAGKTWFWDFASSALSYIGNLVSEGTKKLRGLFNFAREVMGIEVPEPIDPDDAGNIAVINNPNYDYNPKKKSGGYTITPAPIKGGGGGGGSKALFEQEKAIQSLIEKYTKAGEVEKNRIKAEIELTKAKLGMMSEEQRAIEEKAVKLKEQELIHNTMMDGYKKELELAEQINDPKIQKQVIDAIEAQKDAEEKLNEVKKKQVEYEDAILQRKLQTSAFERDMQHIQNLFGMNEITSSQSLEMQNKLLQERKEQLQKALDEDLEMHTLHDEQRIQMETQLMETIKMLNANAAYDVKGGWLQALQEIANQQLNFKDAFSSIFSTIESGLVNLITATGSAKDKFKQFLTDVTNSILKAMTQIIIKGLITKLVMNAIGMGGGNVGVGAGNVTSSGVFSSSNFVGGSLGASGIFVGASGGLVTGQGTSTSDSIHAMLSNGEYVLNAATVRRIGIPKLNAINNGGVPAFASGGYVGGSTNSSAPNVVINVKNETGQQIKAKQGESSFDGKSYIIGIVLEGLATNENGMRDIVKGVAMA